MWNLYLDVPDYKTHIFHDTRLLHEVVLRCENDFTFFSQYNGFGIEMLSKENSSAGGIKLGLITHGSSSHMSYLYKRTYQKMSKVIFTSK